MPISNFSYLRQIDINCSMYSCVCTKSSPSFFPLTFINRKTGIIFQGFLLITQGFFILCIFLRAIFPHNFSDRRQKMYVCVFNNGSRANENELFKWIKRINVYEESMVKWMSLCKIVFLGNYFFKDFLNDLFL